MHRGHVSLPNGLGVDYPDPRGAATVTGAAPNELTASEDRDLFARPRGGRHELITERPAASWYSRRWLC
jgi:hypothetical protein